MNRLLGVFAAVTAAGIDQYSKYLVVEYLPFQQSVPVMPFLSFFHTYNKGIAFSWLSFMDINILMLLILAVTAFFVWLWSQLESDRLLSHLGFGFILAGAVGNLIDRFFLGYVVDFIQVHTQTWSFAIFNLADSFIFVGAAFIVLDEIRQARKAKTGAENE
ncbi:MAG: signal peptidase II [Rhizobiaceae bacterium]|nr:signal peptidase II [Rhizobiaceae bacterium]